MRLFYSPDRPQTDGTITLNANVMNSTGEPLRSGTVDIQALSPSGLSTTIRLTSAGEDSWGLFTGTLTPRESGTWLLTTTCVETGAQLQTSVSVAGEEREKVGRPARIDVLQELTNVTRGQLLNIGESANLIRAVASLPEPQPSVRKLRIWSHPVLAIGLISLLGIFWTCRKLAGLV